jgi:deazaflavin-dependent oxidoreductase (nitroreductase family)
MNTNISNIERLLFRAVNGWVEPLVVSGIAASDRLPLSLIVLETTGCKSGKQRRTPLWSLRIGDYRLVSTVRGKRSFWTKNLKASPRARYFLDGKSSDVETILVTPGFDNVDQWELNAVLKSLLVFLACIAARGWAFALLVPAEEARG